MREKNEINDMLTVVKNQASGDYWEANLRKFSSGQGRKSEPPHGATNYNEIMSSIAESKH